MPLTIYDPPGLPVTPEASSVPDPRLRVRMARWGKHRGAHYHIQALLNPAHLCALLVAVSVCLVGAPWVVPAVLVADLALVTLLPLSRRYRRRVDLSLEELDRAELAKQRELVLTGLADEHRREIEELEQLVDAMHGRRDAAVGFFVEQQLEPERLLVSYLRLALLHKQWSDLQAGVDRAKLAARIAQVEADREDAPLSMLALLDQRLVVLRKRVEHWDRSQQRLEELGQRLEIIGELIRLLHAHAHTPGRAHELEQQLERAVAEVRESEPTLAELAELEGECLRLSPSSSAADWLRWAGDRAGV